MSANRREAVTRHPSNPILTAADFPRRIFGVYNSGVAKVGSKYVMAARVNAMSQRTFLWLCDSEDGVRFVPRPEPVAMPDTDEWRRYANSVYYDPRITKMEGTGEYLMTLACHSDAGCRVGLFRTADFRALQWVDYICAPDNRNIVIFPAKINGMYARLERPNLPGGGNGGGGGGIWISYSPDLIHWGRARQILRQGDFVNYGVGGIGPGSAPLRTRAGWLVLIHGVMPAATILNYSLGAILLDLDDPSKVIGKTEDVLLWPTAPYEQNGLVPNVIFATAMVDEPDGSVKIYYGAADMVQCLALSTVEDLLAAMGK